MPSQSRVRFVTPTVPRDQIVNELLKPENYRNPVSVGSVEKASTYLSDVFLTWDDEAKGDGHAYKLRHVMKDPDLFLDYTTQLKRYRFGLRELDKNFRNAPGFYLGMRGVFQDPDGRIVLDQSRTDLNGAVDAVVAMKRLPKNANLNVAIKAGFDVDPHIEQLSAAIADMHGRADVLGKTKAARMVNSYIQHQLDTARQTDDYIRQTLPDYRSSMVEVFERALNDIKPQLLARCEAGKFRECHGDLWSMNVWWHGGQFLLVDGNEYNKGIAHNDILSDIAFLSIDFMSFEKNDAANRLFESYLRHTGDHADQSLYDVLLGLSWLFIVKVYFKFYQESNGTNQRFYREGLNSLLKIEDRLSRYFANRAI